MLLYLLALIPVAVTFIFTLLDKKTPFKKINKYVKQVIFGVVFGGPNVLRTHITFFKIRFYKSQFVQFFLDKSTLRS